MKTCYVVDPPRFDLSWLYKRYDVKFIIPDKGEAASLRDDPEGLYKHVFYWALDYFKPERDTLALTGNLVMLVMTALAVQAAHPSKCIKMLRYETETETYIEINKHAHAC